MDNMDFVDMTWRAAAPEVLFSTASTLSTWSTSRLPEHLCHTSDRAAILGSEEIMLTGVATILAAMVLTQPPAPPAEARQLALARERAFVSVWLNGVGPYPFLIDTAAPYVALDTPIASTLGLPDAGEAEQLGEFTARPVRVQALAVADWPALSCDAYAADLSPMERPFGMRVAGILGLPGLPRRFRLNFEKRQIGRFPSEMGPEWIEIPLEADADTLLRVPLTVDKEHTVDAVLDTAFAGTLGLAADLLERWGLLSEDTPRLCPADPGAVRDALQIRLAECAVGVVKVNKPLCSVLEDAGPRIGARFLSRFEMAIDREGKKLLLRPLVALPWTDPPLRGAGLAPAERLDGRWSLFVAEDSPAWIGGIEPGDVLGAVNGVDMAGQSFGFVQRALSGKPDTFLDVTVLRGNEVLEFRVAIEEML